MTNTDPEILPINEQGTTETFAHLADKAEAGDAIAQRRLSFLYQGAKGFPEDPAKAFNWMLAAAENGDISAQISVASQYFQGWHIDRSPLEAKRWYLEAAKSGDVHAQYMLAARCAGPDFGHEDFDTAIFWLRKAAHQNRSDLQYFLGGFEGAGLGGEPNFEQSYYWLEVARLNGHVSDGNWIALARAELNASEAEAVRNRASKFVDGCKKFEQHLYEFTPEDWWNSSDANHCSNYVILLCQYEWDASNGIGNPEMHYKLGSLYYLSENRRNLKQVHYWLSKAADEGHQKGSKALKALQTSGMQFDY
ncbi:tetratricopeptide repeat protein [Roseovarius sp. 10]|uniref:tetratricopeptide repeat protein n=1 Tax=Roseovarius sp. 10 TaxID=3080563 RepID=UPI00295571E5|nr:tetratricopeptide repeat protein [Roseovarius sp. 10]MDV7201104.1 tetratricopeptide repeat protein [Roseovarius sp. 10]